MNWQFHGPGMAAVTAEGLRAKGVPKRQSAIVSIMVARSNLQVDKWTQKVATEDCPATQIDPKDLALAKMVTSGHVYPLFNRCHAFHFNPANGWPVIERMKYLSAWQHATDADWMRLGVALHVANDCDGPHALYTGFASRANYNRAREQLQARGEDLPLWTRLFGKSVFVGHMGNPDADRIEYCRDGAQRSAYKLLELMSGGTVDSHDFIVVDGKGQGEATSIQAIRKATDDHDLAVLSAGVFLDRTGMELPKLLPLSGAELETWKSCVRGMA